MAAKTCQAIIGRFANAQLYGGSWEKLNVFASPLAERIVRGDIKAQG